MTTTQTPEVHTGNTCPQCGGNEWSTSLTRRRGNGRYRRFVYVSTCQTAACDKTYTEDAR